ncbi:helix-turn-helix domain-containing protein [Parasphingopyxis marina]|uniref:XRE family transcriptional regulator n=1 Tax=Parasphingopyxis marina TaxID=2761622 RepID=A0A842I3R8_9SPHN|nr:hypothetical protein [Parasphingopyxis marina]MBC2779110.1 hypothetical protein [Parasphingopyxis marina]
MTGEEFTAWLAHMKLSKIAAADLLGIGRNTVAHYEKKGAPAYIGYACAAIAFGLPKWSGV